MQSRIGAGRQGAFRGSEPIRPMGAAGRDPLRLWPAIFDGTTRDTTLAARFQPERHVAALFGPPSEKRFWLRSSGMLEKFGRQVFSSLAGGVFLFEASKLAQTHGGSPVKDIVRDPLRVLDAVNAPSGPKPA